MIKQWVCLLIMFLLFLLLIGGCEDKQEKYENGLAEIGLVMNGIDGERSPKFELKQIICSSVDPNIIGQIVTEPYYSYRTGVDDYVYGVRFITFSSEIVEVDEYEIKEKNEI